VKDRSPMYVMIRRGSNRFHPCVPGRYDRCHFCSSHRTAGSSCHYQHGEFRRSRIQRRHRSSSRTCKHRTSTPWPETDRSSWRVLLCAPFHEGSVQSAPSAGMHSRLTALHANTVVVVERTRMNASRHSTLLCILKEEGVSMLIGILRTAVNSTLDVEVPHSPLTYVAPVIGRLTFSK
jgi:hypothetical protein